MNKYAKVACGSTCINSQNLTLKKSSDISNAFDRLYLHVSPMPKPFLGYSCLENVVSKNLQVNNPSYLTTLQNLNKIPIKSIDQLQTSKGLVNLTLESGYSSQCTESPNSIIQAIKNKCAGLKQNNTKEPNIDQICVTENKKVEQCLNTEASEGKDLQSKQKKKDGDVCSSKNTVPENKKMKDNSREIILSDWIIKPVPDCRGVCVEGQKAGNEDFWHSTAIAEVRKPKVVVTISGSVYRLKGRINKLITIDNGFPQEIACAFVNGFPKNWRELIQQYFTGIEESISISKIESPVKKKIGRKKKSILSDKKTNPEVTPEQSPDLLTRTQHSLISKQLKTSDMVVTRSGRVSLPPLARWVGQHYVKDPTSNSIKIGFKTKTAEQFYSSDTEQALKIPKKLQKDFFHKSLSNSLNSPTLYHSECKENLYHSLPKSHCTRRVSDKSKSKPLTSDLQQHSTDSVPDAVQCNEGKGNNSIRRVSPRKKLKPVSNSDTDDNEGKGNKYIRRVSTRKKLKPVSSSDTDDDKNKRQLRSKEKSVSPMRQKYQQKSDNKEVCTNDKKKSLKKAPSQQKKRKLGSTLDNIESSNLDLNKSSSRLKLKKLNCDGESTFGSQQNAEQSFKELSSHCDGNSLAKLKIASKSTPLSHHGISSDGSSEVHKSKRRKYNTLNKAEETNTNKTVAMMESEINSDVWSEQEENLFHKALQLINNDDPRYWLKVAEHVGTKSDLQCLEYHTKYLENIDKVKRSSQKDKPKPVIKKKEREKGEPIKGGKGTLKRKKDLRDFLDEQNEGYEDDLFQNSPLLRKMPKLPQNFNFPKNDSELFGPNHNFFTPVAGRSISGTPRTSIRAAYASVRKQLPELDTIMEKTPLSSKRRKADIYIKNFNDKKKKAPPVQEWNQASKEIQMSLLPIKSIFSPVTQPSIYIDEKDDDEKQLYYWDDEDN